MNTILPSARRQSCEDNYKTFCDYIRAGLMPTMPRPSILGMPVHRHGAVFVASGELDSSGLKSVFREHLRDLPIEARSRLRVMAFQDEGRQGHQAFFERQGERLHPTGLWRRLVSGLREIDDLALLVIDPLWSFVRDMPHPSEGGDFLAGIGRHLWTAASHLRCQVVAFP